MILFQMGCITYTDKGFVSTALYCEEKSKDVKQSTEQYICFHPSLDTIQHLRKIVLGVTGATLFYTDEPSYSLNLV